jgi:REP element-mobilizing transposase RayT
VWLPLTYHTMSRSVGTGGASSCSATPIEQSTSRLLRENIVLYGVALIGYCLMSNHIHLIVIPHKVDVLAQALKQIHGRYASYWNATRQSNGHVWQGRFDLLSLAHVQYPPGTSKVRRSFHENGVKDAPLHLACSKPSCEVLSGIGLTDALPVVKRHGESQGLGNAECRK